ncbi:hypothetical protein LEP1GSC172_0495 [Leptospira noguchii]|uniref:Uncharacterized protein n=2 Tax=Leptospira noguchii TaxID=28182 RepID=T0FNB1_9LEPT|nr:hypothetical protein LEP1GSC172_0495 [Leptospira noguchii]EQA71025.1 hypothetical protein LEP1GSC059_3134 [Leptospira noguchii serovar Panama str. CZ214]
MNIHFIEFKFVDPVSIAHATVLRNSISKTVRSYKIDYHKFDIGIKSIFNIQKRKYTINS